MDTIMEEVTTGNLENGKENGSQRENIAKSTAFRAVPEHDGPGIPQVGSHGQALENMDDQSGQEPKEMPPLKKSSESKNGNAGQMARPSSVMETHESMESGGFKVAGDGKSNKFSMADEEARTRKSLMGVTISKTHAPNDKFTARDLAYFFTGVKHVDPKAVILPSNKEVKQARPVGEMTGCMLMDLRGFLDVHTTAWGKPSEGKERTTWSFWLATDVIKPGLHELREDLEFAKMLRLGQLSMSQTNLHQSRSKVVALLQGKDPRHTHRQSMVNRFQQHLKEHTQKEIPCNVVLTREYGFQILALAVGSKDAKAVEAVLQKNPLPLMELIFKSWRKPSNLHVQYTQPLPQTLTC